MDVSPGMSSSESLDSQGPALTAFFRFHWSVSACGSRIQTSSTTHTNLTFGLRIEVNQNFALQQARFELLGPGKSGFLVKSYKHLQRTVFDVIGLEHSQSHSHTQTVIGT